MMDSPDLFTPAGEPNAPLAERLRPKRVEDVVGHGGYLRIYPLLLTRWAIERLNASERVPAVVYVHPWEVVPSQPRIAAPLVSRFRHYWGLSTTARKLESLLSRYRFGTVSEVLARSSDIPIVALDAGVNHPVAAAS